MHRVLPPSCRVSLRSQYRVNANFFAASRLSSSLSHISNSNSNSKSTIATSKRGPKQQHSMSMPMSMPMSMSSNAAMKVMSSNSSNKNDDDDDRNERGSVLSTHYSVHANAESYDNAYFYKPGAYMEHLVGVARERLQLTPQRQLPKGRCILDIGGGTGTFAEALVADDTNAKVVVVEPFLEPGVSETNSSGNVSFLKESAEDFMVPPTEDCWRTTVIDRNHGGYDQIMLKEVVHHFAEKDRVGIFRGMLQGLRKQPEGGNMPSLLIITRPQTDIEYPLWDEAHQVWIENQPSIEDIEEDLRTAGYTELERSVEPIACSISLSRWQTMVKSRCWSTFSNFTDDELEEACAIIASEARSKNGDGEQDPILRFDDRLILLVAS